MKRVAITGAGSGLGRALAHEYGKQGYHVFLLGRGDNKLLLVRHELSQAGRSSEIVLCDVRQEASVSIAFQQIGELDVFINNAGIGIFGPLETYSIDHIDETLNTNMKGTILAVQAALPLVKERNGRILTIISTAGLRGKTDESIYAASKFAIRGFTESLQKEWENSPLTITAVYMGGMNTPFWQNSDHVPDPSNLKSPENAASRIFSEDDGRKEIIVDS